MAFLAKIVANCFLQRDFEDGRATISPMKLQKAGLSSPWLESGHCGRACDRQPISRVALWSGRRGAVSYFQAVSGKPDNGIRHVLGWRRKKALVVEKNGNEIFYMIFDFVVSRYMPMTALQLSTLTHQPGTTWSITRGKGEMIIPNELIKEHFKGTASK